MAPLRRLVLTPPGLLRTLRKVACRDGTILILPNSPNLIRLVCLQCKMLVFAIITIRIGKNGRIPFPIMQQEIYIREQKCIISYLMHSFHILVIRIVP